MLSEITAAGSLKRFEATQTHTAEGLSNRRAGNKQSHRQRVESYTSSCTHKGALPPSGGESSLSPHAPLHDVMLGDPQVAEGVTCELHRRVGGANTQREPTERFAGS